MNIGAIDKDAVRELILFAENDYRLYDTLHKVYLPNLEKKAKKGIYNKEKAIKLIEYYYQNYVRPSYKRQLGDDIKLNPESRKSFSKHFVEVLEDEYDLKNKRK